VRQPPLGGGGATPRAARAQAMEEAAAAARAAAAAAAAGAAAEAEDEAAGAAAGAGDGAGAGLRFWARARDVAPVGVYVRAAAPGEPPPPRFLLPPGEFAQRVQRPWPAGAPAGIGL